MFVINNLLATKVLVNYDLKKVLFGPFSYLFSDKDAAPIPNALEATEPRI